MKKNSKSAPPSRRSQLFFDAEAPLAPPPRPVKLSRAEMTPRQKMQRAWSNIILVVLIAVSCGTAGYAVMSLMGEKDPPSPPTPTFTPIPFPSNRAPVDPNAFHTPRPTLAPPGTYLIQNLRETNPEVMGKITVPDTQIDHVICQADNDSKYLTTAWDLTPSKAGAIFIDSRNNPDFSDQNTIVYGHRRNSGQMFYDLQKYKDPAWAKVNQVFTIVLEDKVLQCTVFAVCVLDAKAEYRNVYYDNAKEFDDFMTRIIDTTKNQYKMDLGVRPVFGQRIVSLSTCDYTNPNLASGGRLAIFALLPDEAFPYDWTPPS